MISFKIWKPIGWITYVPFLPKVPGIAPQATSSCLFLDSKEGIPESLSA